MNGELTLAENVGDLVGLSIAHQAYTLSRKGRAAPVIDGLTGDQRFFLSWARVWRGRLRDEYMRQWVLLGARALAVPERTRRPATSRHSTTRSR